ncbi:21.7 kDa class VI heat shock protein isoform X2 [Euphorbia lathyris]|uniref:21.7 kDa class VI heat shock protein isoform X2 n=1 Tax=Euphorbia lathyris TaxID=212925 RepID=UPI0033140692
MATCRLLEIQVEDHHPPNKWSVSLTEQVFKTFLALPHPILHKVFGDGSFFSPLLFGKFFDPSDAFPLWDFESDVLLSNLRSSSKTNLDWSETNDAYLLKSELPGIGMSTVGIGVNGEKGKIMEISGQWKQQQREREGDWRSGNWWENGYVRRIEVPQDGDWKKIEAHLINDVFLEVQFGLVRHYSSNTIS